MKWFEGIDRGPFNDQREALRRPRKTTKKIAPHSVSKKLGDDCEELSVKQVVHFSNTLIKVTVR